jgi:hypothetical protein
MPLNETFYHTHPHTHTKRFTFVISNSEPRTNTNMSDADIARQLQLAEYKRIPCRNGPKCTVRGCKYGHDALQQAAARPHRPLQAQSSNAPQQAPATRASQHPRAAPSRAPRQPNMPDVDNMSYEELLALQERIGHVKIGISADRLRAMPVITVRAAGGFLPSQAQSSCCICIENFVQGDRMRFAPCGHAFHQQCIDPWLAEHTQCPMCKCDLAEKTQSVADAAFAMLMSRK